MYSRYVGLEFVFVGFILAVNGKPEDLDFPSDRQDCFNNEVDLRFGDLRRISDILSAAACQDLCKEEERCIEFVWAGPEFPRMPNTCFLKHGKYRPADYIRHKEGVVSGPKNCEPAESCEFTSGDTTGGPEYQVDKADTAEGCAKNVRLSTYSHKATGATWNPESKQCWAETGNSIAASSVYRTCHFLTTKCFEVKLTTANYGEEISWTLGSCESDGSYGNDEEYWQKCCLKPGSYFLACKDNYGDGWHGGYIEVDGIKYCESFTSGDKETNEIIVQDGK